jgi:hypothetical protein
MKIAHAFTAATGVMAACLFAADAALAADPGTQASVIAMNQKAKDDSVSITYAYAPKNGTLEIFSANPEKASSAKPLGEVALSAGDHRDISVKLNPEPKAGTQLWAVVEQGKGPKPFSNLDGPAQQTYKVM